MAHCYRHPNRETGLSCSDCGRPICTDCATFMPVGIRCPDHSGQPQGMERVRTAPRQLSLVGGQGLVTKILIGLNVMVFVINLSQGASLNSNAGQLYFDWFLIGEAQTFDGTIIGVAHGDWWRLVTSAFLHGGIIHLGFNMVLLWYMGIPVEAALGRGRFIAVYLVSALAGSAGALLLSAPGTVTVGASGAIFGILGAALVIDRRGVLGSSALTIIVLNLALTFAVPGISIGGHVGGLVGGILSTLAFSRFGRGHAVYGRLGFLGYAGVIAVGVLAVGLAYARVRGYS